MNSKLETIYLRYINELIGYVRSEGGDVNKYGDLPTMEPLSEGCKEALLNLAEEREQLWNDVENIIDERLKSGVISQHYNLHITENSTYCLYNDFGTVVANCSLDTVESQDLITLLGLQNFIKSKLPIKTGDVVDISITTS